MPLVFSYLGVRERAPDTTHEEQAADTTLQALHFTTGELCAMSAIARNGLVSGDVTTHLMLAI
ncbi:hypothetical protein [Boseongicola sp. H5]|uniref:hypothetical protein n=1 Tax=Boseongicola sp. H5 TaxID=2763261 RepID=UPI001D0A173C|nr:hypothetical protein [Boseongicola sp. H5]